VAVAEAGLHRDGEIDLVAMTANARRDFIMYDRMYRGLSRDWGDDNDFDTTGRVIFRLGA
jgi:hypothetical protein